MTDKKQQSAKYESIMASLKDGIFEPVYLLMGDEPYFIDRITDYIAANAVDEEDADFNVSVLYGSETSAAAVVDTARMFPVLPSRRRLVIVKEAQGLKSMDALEKYFERPLSSTVMVICYKNGTIDKRKKIIGKAEAVGVVFESKKKKDYELVQFITKYLKTNHGVAIDNKSAAMIVEHTGTELNMIVSELEKLMLSMGKDKASITPETIEREIGVSKDFNSFELRSALIEKNAYKAYQIVKYFDRNPKSGLLYTSMPVLFNFFQTLMIAFYCPSANDENKLADYLGLKSVWGIRDYLTGMRNFSPSKTLRILSKIREIDAKSKGLDNVSTSPSELMKELVAYILY